MSGSTLLLKYAYQNIQGKYTVLDMLFCDVALKSGVFIQTLIFSYFSTKTYIVDTH